jgi:hypothetical protein
MAATLCLQVVTRTLASALLPPLPVNSSEVLQPLPLSMVIGLRLNNKFSRVVIMEGDEFDAMALFNCTYAPSHYAALF